MSWIQLVLGLIKILTFLIDWGKKREYMAAGKAEMAREQLENMAHEVKKARAANDAVSDDADSVQNDEFNRDRNADS